MIKKELVSYGLGYCFFFLINATLTFIINKYLPDNDIGKITYTIGIITLLSSVFSLSSSQAHLRFYKTSNNDIAKLIRIIAIFGTSILFISSYYFFNSIYVASLSFMILFNERLYFYRSRGEISKFNFLKIGWGILTFLSIVIVLATSLRQLNKEILFLIYGITYLMFGIKLDFNFNPPNLNWKKLKKILLYTLPILITEILTWSLAYLNQIVINKNLDEITLTEYNVAFKLIVLLKGITTVFLLFYPQYYFQEADQGSIKTTRVIRKYFIISLAGAGIIAILNSSFLYWIIGAGRFETTQNIFRLLLISEVLRTIGAIYFLYRSYLKQTYWQTICTLLALLVLASLIFLKWDGRNIYQLLHFHLLSNLIFLILSLFLNLNGERKTFKKNSSI